MSEIITEKGTWKGPRWAGMETFLLNLAFNLDLEISIEIEKHLIRESGRFKVTGKRSSIQKFSQAFERAIHSYNKA